MSTAIPAVESAAAALGSMIGFRSADADKGRRAILAKAIKTMAAVPGSVISTRFLGDAARVDFWVSQLLVAVSRWCAKSPQGRLQAVFLSV